MTLAGTYAIGRLASFARNAPRRLRLIGDALDAVANGALYEALLNVDICCRLPVVSPDDLLLRSEIYSRLGRADLADEDVRAAYAIDPTRPAVVSRYLAIMRAKGALAQADTIAWAGARPGADLAVNPDCVRYLIERQNVAGIAMWRVTGTSAQLILLSSRADQIVLDVTTGSKRFKLACSLSSTHPSSSVLGFAAALEFPWEDGADSLAVTGGDGIAWRQRAVFRPMYQPSPASIPGRASTPSSPCLNIIVPVYRGFAETRRCLSALVEQRMKRPYRIVLIDDCGPDPELRALLKEYAGQKGIHLIRNPFNIGFIGSVNRALKAYPSGDVLLLNADTILPPGALGRLAEAAHAEPDIGTVTPLSNNGELTSFPRPFAPSPLPDNQTIYAIDRAAQASNPRMKIDLPNGVGFCLYVREACRQSIGILNDVDFVEGYLEEVDFCLRAAEAGFRNVCACNVFVGHAGGTSFEDRRRDLVMRNLAVLQRYFPDVRSRTHHFLSADPLKKARQALQAHLLRHALFDGGKRHLRMTSRPSTRSTRARGDIDRWVAHEEILLSVDPRRPLTISLTAADVPAPYEFEVTLRASDPEEDLRELLSPFKVTSLTIEDGPAPQWISRVAATLGIDPPLGSRVHDLIEPGPIAGGERHNGLPTPQHVRTDQAVSIDVGSDGKSSQTCREQTMHRGSVDKLLTPTIMSRGPLSIAVLCLEGTSLSWLIKLARWGLRLKQPLRYVVFGDVAEPAQLEQTGVINLVGLPPVHLAPALFAVHGCIATVIAKGGRLDSGPISDLARLAPRPVFVDHIDQLDQIEFMELEVGAITATDLAAIEILHDHLRSVLRESGATIHAL